MTSRSHAAIQVQTAVPSRAVGRRIAARLLEQRLCACAQITGPVTSAYHWRGQIETAREWLLILKTRATHFAALERVIRALHPYEVPEIIATAIESGSAAYLEWLRAETLEPGRAPRGRQRASPSGRRR